MIKIFVLLMILSAPNQPSVQYNAIIYTTELDCNHAKGLYMESYNKQSKANKEKLTTEATCIPFNSFPLTTMKGMDS